MVLSSSDRVKRDCGNCPGCSDDVKSCLTGVTARVLKRNAHMEDHIDLETMDGKYKGAVKACPVWTITENYDESERAENKRIGEMKKLVSDRAAAAGVKTINDDYGLRCFNCRAGVSETHGPKCTHQGVFGA
jgi:hypothetical protein